MPPSTTMATSSIEPRKPATSGVIRPLNSARNDPATDAYTAEMMKTMSFLRATSMPSTRAAISLSWMACSARPVGLSIRLSASRNPPTNVAPAIQYQTSDPCTRQPKSRKRGDVHAVRTAGPACLVGQHDGDEQPEAERGDGEIVPFELEDRPADSERDQRPRAARRRTGRAKTARQDAPGPMATA